MRLLQLQDNDDLSLVQFFGKAIPPYATLSHTWAQPAYQEVTYNDVVDGIYKSKLGYQKILFCGKRALKDGLQYFWVDTCCIDKSSSAELSEAINSMFRWYRDSAKCYVYLSDVTYDDSDRSKSEQAFMQSKWFTRGWTLQELLAPASIEFFSCEGKLLGDKESLESQIHDATGIPIEAIRGAPLSGYRISERISWAAKRETTREEDQAYCLLGIFGVFMSVIYGEGVEHAFLRLRKEVPEDSSKSP
jgi:hypothetical protein